MRLRVSLILLAALSLAALPALSNTLYVPRADGDLNYETGIAISSTEPVPGVVTSSAFSKADQETLHV
jgi:hypothetical protein